MNLRRLLLYPPASWVLAWAFNDPAVKQSHNRFIHDHNPTKDEPDASTTP